MWQDLEKRSNAHVFLSWPWMANWLAAIASPPRLLVARCDDRVVGLAFVGFAVASRHKILRVPTLYLNEFGIPDLDVITIEFNDVLADASITSNVRRACLHSC